MRRVRDVAGVDPSELAHLEATVPSTGTLQVSKEDLGGPPRPVPPEDAAGAAPVAGDDRLSGGEVFAVCLMVVTTVLVTMAEAIYAGLQRPMPDSAERLTTFLWVLLFSAWLTAYARRLRLGLPMDLGMILSALWIVLVPYYLFRTMGWRALVPIGAFVLLWLVTALVGGVVSGALAG